MKTLQMKKALRFALLFLLLGVAGIAKLQAQTGNIIFADDNVKAICVDNWDTGGDKELSYAEAAAVTNLSLAFNGKSNITSFDELQYFISLTSIDAFDFSGCTSLASVGIPNSVTYFGWNAFKNCSSLTSVEIPNSVTSVEVGAFEGCSGLTSVYYTGDVAQWCGIVFYGNYANPLYSGHNLYINNELVTALVIPNSVTSIGNYAFHGCTGLISVEIPNSVTSIGNYVFYGCTGLTSVEIPNSVTSIGNFAFHGCTGLTSVEILNSVTSIGNSAFNGCIGLTSVEIPNSVTSIGSSAFSGCIGLTSIEIPNSVISLGEEAFNGCTGLNSMMVASGNTKYDSRDNCNAIIETATNTLVAGCKNTVIPNTVTSIGNYAFCGCTGLTSVEIPNFVTSIGNSAFNGCIGLTSVEIPNSVTSIDVGAFAECRNLTSVEIPNSVSFIGFQAFAKCTGLTEIIMLGIEVPSLEWNVFVLTNNCPIYVPYESLSNYKTASNWSSYASRIHPWLQKSVTGYGESTDSDKWVFTASPIASDISPEDVTNLIATTTIEYDLYRYNPNAELEWENYKNPDHTAGFVLENGKGYLYANKNDVDLMFKGDVFTGDYKDVTLSSGWNLVGNPYPQASYINRTYYKMNAAGDDIDPVSAYTTTTIPTCTGVMVQATGTETVRFSTTAPANAALNQGALQITVAQANVRDNAIQDKAIVSFNEGEQLGKYVFNVNHAKLSIPQNGEEYAIAFSEGQGEMPLNFKANQNGEYTLTIETEGVTKDYLHLIDNLTGNDIDLLATPSYTFTAKTTDYASRFRLVFSANGVIDNQEDSNVNFAYINNGEIVLANAESGAILQIVDMMGRILVSTEGVHTVSTSGIPAGLYVLRLIEGNNVKTQKIVIE